jgi:hypothetical protein
MDSSRDWIGIDVPESLLTRHERSHLMGNDTLIAVDLAKTVFEIAVSHRSAKWTSATACRESTFSRSS